MRIAGAVDRTTRGDAGERAFQRLALSADRPGLTLQILALARPHPVRGELSAIFGIEPGREAARHDAVSTGRLANAFPLDGRKKSYLHRTTCLALATSPRATSSSRSKAPSPIATRR